MPRHRYTTEVGLRRRRFRILRWTIYVLLSAACITVLIALFFLYLPLFQVQKLSISGNGYIPADRIQSVLEARILDSSRWKHLLGIQNILVWPDRLTPEDLKLLPEAADVSIAKNYFTRTVEVEVTPRQHVGVWCFESGPAPSCYWFDEQGLITRTPATQGSLILSVDDYARSGILPGQALLPPELLPNIFSIFDALQQMNLNVQEIRLEDLALEEIKVPTFNGPTLLFSLRFPATDTPAALDVLRAKTAISKLSTIDFRVENRIYYK